MASVPVHVTELDGIPRVGEPVTLGVPFPRGGVVDPTKLRLRDHDGRLVPLQTSALARWSDGSLKWALLDFQVWLAAHASTEYRVVVLDEPEPCAAEVSPIRIVEESDVFRVDTGAARFTVDRLRFRPLLGAVVENQALLDSVGSECEVVTSAGETCTPTVTRSTVECRGPLRAELCLQGTFDTARGRPFCEFTARLSFFADRDTVKVALTLRNSRRARHHGNLWDLGDAGSVLIRDASLTMRLGGSEPARLACSCAVGEPALELDSTELELYQDSSGGEQWDSPNHVNRHGCVPNAFRGYRLRLGGAEQRGNRAQPLIGVWAGRRGAVATVAHFWENFPKAIEVAERCLTVRFFPLQYRDVHELQGGEQKTHVLYLAFPPDRDELRSLDWARSPLVPHAAPEWYAATGAVPYLTPRSTDPSTDYLALVDAAIEGDDTFARKREVADEYGWRHFGDLPADHEGIYYSGPPPVISHYNNQYDAIQGAVLSFIRSGDRRWFELLDRLAAHVVDIDIYHTDQDRAAFNHGFFWHTDHYKSAMTATHRAFSWRNGSPGGGPCNEHSYTTGLLHHYYLTGDPSSRQAVLDAAGWILAMDDGRRHVLGWVDGGDTGFASATGSRDYHGPGRGAGNAIQTALNGYVLSGERRFLDKAEALIRRCIHPEDDVAARQLLDAEQQWSYTVFLQTLGRYLDLKIEWGQLDEMYAYAQASLLHYVRWMAAHEVGYLSRSDQLEYPTETWSAHEMRKSDVFHYATKHASGPERARFHERAEFFFRASVEELTSAKTRSLTRPVVIMMTCGFMHAYWQTHPDETAPRVPGEVVFRAPERFVPQRQRVLAKLPLAGALVVGGLTLASKTLLIARRSLAGRRPR